METTIIAVRKKRNSFEVSDTMGTLCNMALVKPSNVVWNRYMIYVEGAMPQRILLIIKALFLDSHVETYITVAIPK